MIRKVVFPIFIGTNTDRAGSASSIITGWR